MRVLAPRERRLIALGLLVLALAMVWLVAVRPVLDGFDEREASREQLGFQYARNERIIGGIRASRVTARAQRASAGDFVLDAPNPALAIDGLRERVARAARAQGVKLGAVQETQAPPGRIAVRADLTIPPGKLASFIAAVRNGRPLIVVEQLVVNADQAETSGYATPLTVRLDVSARYDSARARTDG